MIAYLSGIMELGLEFFFTYTQSYGLAIIALTVAIKLILLPLTIKQTKSMKKMQEIAPLQKKLQEKYKNNKEKLNKEITELYRKHQVNPLSGCLPLLVQLPFLIGLFRLLHEFNFGDEANFLWISHLGEPDGTFIIPILAALTTFLSTKLTSGSAQAAQQQKTMMYMMPLLIGFMSTRFPSGLALYWVVSNIVQIAQQLIVAGKDSAIAKEESS